MSLNLKPKKQNELTMDKLKAEAILNASSSDEIKVSVDIEESLYLKMMELKLTTKKVQRKNLYIKTIINNALKEYLNKE